MATNFFEIGKGGASSVKTVDYSKGLEPIVDKFNKMAEESKAKTEALVAAMPQGVAIDKVPEELRGEVTSFLSKGKQEYLKASKVIASGIRADDQRYIDAVATINKVQNKFQSLSDQLEDIAVKRQNALDNRDHSDGAYDWEISDHEGLANGNMYSSFKLQDDGTFNYTSSDGNVKKWSDYSNTFQKSGAGQEGFIAIADKAKQDCRYGEAFDENTYRNLFTSLRKTLKTDGNRDFLFSDEEFLEEITGEKFGTDEYKKAVNQLRNKGSFESLMDQYEDYAIEELRQVHGSALGNYQQRQNKQTKQRDTLPVNYGVGYITRNSAETLIDDMKNKRDIISLNDGTSYRFDENKQQYYVMGTEPREYKSNMFILGTDGLWQQGYRIGEFNADMEEKNKQNKDNIINDALDNKKKQRKNSGSFFRNVYDELID